MGLFPSIYGIITFFFKVCHVCSTLQMRNEVAFTLEEMQQNAIQESARMMSQAMQMYQGNQQPGNTNLSRIS